MNDDSVLTRIQVSAAIRYIDRTSNDYEIDMRSCRFWARIFKFR